MSHNMGKAIASLGIAAATMFTVWVTKDGAYAGGLGLIVAIYLFA